MGTISTALTDTSLSDTTPILKLPGNNGGTQFNLAVNKNNPKTKTTKTTCVTAIVSKTYYQLMYYLTDHRT